MFSQRIYYRFRNRMIPFLLLHVFEHTHGLKKMEIDTTDNQAAFRLS